MKVLTRVIQYIYDSFIGLSPHCELFARRLYWSNVSKLSKFKKKSNKVQEKACVSACNWESIINYLQTNGVSQGRILIVHSSYDALEATGKTPDEIIDALMELVGPDGTLCMPVIRKYKDLIKPQEYLTKDVEVTCDYKVRKTVVCSGLLPYTMMLRPESVVSRHPLNPLVAIGPLAHKMMSHNIDGVNPSAHGENSSWKFCADHNAIVVGLGIQFMHHITIIHVTEETNIDWLVKDWYRTRKFNIIDGEYNQSITVSERRPKWGAIYLLENSMRRDFIKNKIVKSTLIDDVEIGIANSSEIIGFCRNNKNPTYPYFIPKKYFK